jgi:hypothetical protein
VNARWVGRHERRNVYLTNPVISGDVRVATQAIRGVPHGNPVVGMLTTSATGKV